MAEKGASESKSSKSKTPAKTSSSPLSSGKSSSRSSTKAAPDMIDSGKMEGSGNRRTIGIIIGVLVVLLLCCLCTLATFWFTGDAILEFFNSML